MNYNMNVFGMTATAGARDRVRQLGRVGMIFRRLRLGRKQGSNASASCLVSLRLSATPSKSVVIALMSSLERDKIDC
jgi:hypothetical protein